MSYALLSKHEEFCIGVARGMTAQEAYIFAGYSENGAAQSASRLLRNANIRSRIRGLRITIANQAVEEAALSQAYVINRLMTIVEQCMQHEPIRDSSGAVLGYSSYKPMAAIRALELLGKHLGMFTGRPERKPVTEYRTIAGIEQSRAELDKRLKEFDRQPKPKRLRKARGTLH
jgi:phage terminase small subunit